jgi:hypothetical protein
MMGVREIIPRQKMWQNNLRNNKWKARLDQSFKSKPENPPTVHSWEATEGGRVSVFLGYNKYLYNNI